MSFHAFRSISLGQNPETQTWLLGVLDVRIGALIGPNGALVPPFRTMVGNHEVEAPDVS
jgi:hypothetical protein